MKNQFASYDDSFVDTLRDLKEEIPKAKAIIDTNKLPERVSHIVKSGGGLFEGDLERIIGTNDLVRINYMERGLLASMAVCRIYVPEPFGNKASWGTGFLISPNLLITNNHVIPSTSQASMSFAEFGYEADVKGILKQGKRFSLRPDLTFVTSDINDFDFTIIAVEQLSDDGVTKLSNYGFVRLNPNLNKILEGEYATIIQHPDGEEKQIALRENKVTKIGDQFDANKDKLLWYSSDTAPGSSGSPVLNDSWQVVALHHRGVPVTRTDNGIEQVQLTDNSWVSRDEAEDKPIYQVKYIANEGIRVSKIVEETGKQYEDSTTPKYQFIKDFLDDANGIKSFPNTNVSSSIVSPIFESAAASAPALEKTSGKNIHPISYYAGKTGYNTDFLTQRVELPSLTSSALHFGEPAKLIGSSEIELKYTHFSVILNANRKIAFFTAVNIDGQKWTNINRGDDKWFYDSRIPLELQVADELYGNEPKGDKNKGWFDRGHLVRRMDPDWGTIEVAMQADEDTFHWTNCSPQYWGFNQGKDLWQGLENYILYNTDKEDIKATVFTGPVFGDDDEMHRGILIPQYFFKVVVVDDTQGKLYSSAYVVSQKKYAQNIPFEEIPVGHPENVNATQTSIRKLEAVTGIDFGQVVRDNDVNKIGKDFDLKSLADIKMARRS